MPKRIRKIGTTPCSISGCEKMARARGLCKNHYRRFLLYKDPLAGCIAPGTALKFLNQTVLNYESDECLVWPFNIDRSGYARLHWEGKPKVVSIIICEKKHGPKPTIKHEVAHSCNVRNCVNYRHLRWATRAENHADKIIHGTHQCGERNPSAKLTERQVMDIPKLMDTFSQSEIARQFGVSVSCINLVYRGNSWVHVPRPEGLNSKGNK